jgi:CubicO group peptidase (beta-lactamase class C family)
MASQSVADSKSVAAFIPDFELLIAEAMDEWKIPGLAITVVQNGEVALVGAYGLRDVEAGLKVTTEVHDLLDHQVVHPHGLGPFGGREAPRLEEAGLYSGIPTA